jgi:hypothetical protein
MHETGVRAEHGKDSSIYRAFCTPCGWIGRDRRKRWRAEDDIEAHVEARPDPKGDPDHWARPTEPPLE